MSWKCCFLLMMTIFSAEVALAQDLETKLLRLLEQNNLEAIYSNLTAIKQKFPAQPIPYYVEAFIERDADYAFQLYRDFVQRFPQSTYTASARYKMAQYFIARNDYEQAVTMVDEFLALHADSPLADDAQYLKITALLTTNRTSEANREFERMQAHFPNSQFKTVLLENFTAKPTSSVVATQEQPAPRQSTGVYTIQAGAFSNLENAQLLKTKITNRGYPAEITTKRIDHTTMYLVWIGNFQSEEQAEAFGELFKREFLMPVQVVQK
jgi:hypothetical protein